MKKIIFAITGASGAIYFWVDGWMGEWVYGYMGGWVNGYMGGWVDEGF